MLFHEWCYHVISTYSVIISNELLTGCHPASAKIFSMWEWCREKWLLHYTFIWASLLICSSVLMTRLSPPFIFCLFIALLSMYLFIFFLVLTEEIFIFNKPSNTRVLLLCRWYYVESQLWSNQTGAGFLPPIAAVRPALQLQAGRWVCTDVLVLFI